MIKFLWKKLMRNKWLTFSLLLGNILLIGIASGSPLYVTATRQRVMMQDFQNVAARRNTFPATVQFRYTFSAIQEEHALQTYYETRDFWWPGVLEDIGIPTETTITSFILHLQTVSPVVVRGDPANQSRTTNFVGIDGIEEFVTVTHGRLPAPYLVDGNILEVITMDSALLQRDFLMDELMRFDTDIPGFPNGLYMRIVGIYEPTVEGMAFWDLAPGDPRITMYTTADIMYTTFARNFTSGLSLQAFWTEVLDYTEMRVTMVDHYLDRVAHHQEEFRAHAVWWFSQNLTHALFGQAERTATLNTTLWVLLVPIIVMLALYIYMVSRQILSIDTNDISVLRSRGASRFKILYLYFAQGVVVGVVSFPIGLALGVLITQVIGASNGFMELVGREALTIIFTPDVFLIAGGFSLCSV